MQKVKFDGLLFQVNASLVNYLINTLVINSSGTKNGAKNRKGRVSRDSHIA